MTHWYHAKRAKAAADARAVADERSESGGSRHGQSQMSPGEAAARLRALGYGNAAAGMGGMGGL